MLLYQHFKGGLYIVDSVLCNNASNKMDGLDRVVAYRCINTGAFYVREFNEFHEHVEYEGKTGPRFRVIMDAADIMPEGGHP